MSKVFRPWEVEQTWLLPPSIHELVPAEHPAHFVRELVRTELDLRAIYAAYDEERGFPPYHPAMMTALLLYAYTQGLFSSRKIARACEERVDVMAVTAMQRPDFRTIAKFRVRHLDALAGLFQQVLRLCKRAGLVRLGHVALDGTKVKANASKHKAMSYGRMKEAEPELAKVVDDWFMRASNEDATDDTALGDARGDELPAWVANRQARLAKLREAKVALEEEARVAVERDPSDDDDQDPPEVAPPPHHVDGTPTDRAQRNFTDPESRILKTSDGYIQGYNAQTAVDAEHQVIVAQFVVSAQNDAPYLSRLLDEVRANTGQQADEVSADTGYCSEANLRTLARRRIRGYIATGRQRHGDTAATGQRTQGLAAKMTQRLRRAGHRSRYRLRKVVVEPVFGQIKRVLGFTTFFLRGIRKVNGEWALVSTAHNLRKLIAAR
jgi:transposase